MFEILNSESEKFTSVASFVLCRRDFRTVIKTQNDSSSTKSSMLSYFFEVAHEEIAVKKPALQNEHGVGAVAVLFSTLQTRNVSSQLNSSTQASQPKKCRIGHQNCRMRDPVGI